MAPEDADFTQNIPELLSSVHFPAWVNWVAQDADGTWWGYDTEPNQSHIGWYENEVGDSVKLLKSAKNDNWQQTLARIHSDYSDV